MSFSDVIDFLKKNFPNVRVYTDPLSLSTSLVSQTESFRFEIPLRRIYGKLIVPKYSYITKDGRAVFEAYPNRSILIITKGYKLTFEYPSVLPIFTDRNEIISFLSDIANNGFEAFINKIKSLV